MAGIGKTRVGYDEPGPGSKDKRVGGMSSGLAGVSGARAQKPVKGTMDSNTVSASKATPTGRPTGSK